MLRFSLVHALLPTYVLKMDKLTDDLHAAQKRVERLKKELDTEIWTVGFLQRLKCARALLTQERDLISRQLDKCNDFVTVVESNPVFADEISKLSKIGQLHLLSITSTEKQLRLDLSRPELVVAFVEAHGAEARERHEIARRLRHKQGPVSERVQNCIKKPNENDPARRNGGKAVPGEPISLKRKRTDSSLHESDANSSADVNSLVRERIVTDRILLGTSDDIVSGSDECQASPFSLASQQADIIQGPDWSGVDTKAHKLQAIPREDSMAIQPGTQRQHALSSDHPGKTVPPPQGDLWESPGGHGRGSNSPPEHQVSQLADFPKAMLNED
jgi:hypothetical protein